MRSHAHRAAVTSAVCAISLWLLACPFGRLRVLIPDFTTSDVRGVRVLRVDDAGGRLVPAGSLQFLGIEADAQSGEMIAYRQLTAEGQPWFGPFRSVVVRHAERPTALEVELTFLNPLDAGYFKVASYNAVGTSRPSAGQSFMPTAPVR